MTTNSPHEDLNPYAAPSASGDSWSQPPNDRRYPLQEQVTVDVETYVRGMDVHVGWRRPLLRVTAFLVGLLSAGVSALFLFGFNDLPGTFVFLVGAVFLVIYSFAARRWSRRTVAKRLRQMSREYQDVLYEVTPESLRIATDDGESRISWEKIFKWKEGSGVLLVYRHGALYHVVPMGQFDVETQNAIRGFLGTHSRP